MEKYNGWSNRDTWLVMLWLENDEQNYRRLVNEVKGIGTKKLLSLDEEDFKNKLKTFNYGDKIYWKNVNIKEIYEILKEEYEEE